LLQGKAVQREKELYKAQIVSLREQLTMHTRSDIPPALSVPIASSMTPTPSLFATIAVAATTGGNAPKLATGPPLLRRTADAVVAAMPRAAAPAPQTHIDASNVYTPPPPTACTASLGMQAAAAGDHVAPAATPAVALSPLQPRPERLDLALIDGASSSSAAQTHDTATPHSVLHPSAATAPDDPGAPFTVAPPTKLGWQQLCESDAHSEVSNGHHNGALITPSVDPTMQTMVTGPADQVAIDWQVRHAANAMRLDAQLTQGAEAAGAWDASNVNRRW
jgi:hypothetical protein